jgi:hypothetical protein
MTMDRWDDERFGFAQWNPLASDIDQYFTNANFEEMFGHGEGAGIDFEDLRRQAHKALDEK